MPASRVDVEHVQHVQRLLRAAQGGEQLKPGIGLQRTAGPFIAAALQTSLRVHKCPHEGIDSDMLLEVAGRDPGGELQVFVLDRVVEAPVTSCQGCQMAQPGVREAAMLARLPRLWRRARPFLSRTCIRPTTPETQQHPTASCPSLPNSPSMTTAYGMILGEQNAVCAATVGNKSATSLPCDHGVARSTSRHPSSRSELLVSSPSGSQNRDACLIPAPLVAVRPVLQTLKALHFSAHSPTTPQ